LRDYLYNFIILKTTQRQGNGSFIESNINNTETIVS